MLGYNAIGMDAVGAGTNSATPSNLSCSLSATSTLSASLTTKIVLAATIGAVATLSASLTTGTTSLRATLTASSNLTADLTTAQVTPMFTPSTARTINVQATTPVFVGGKWWNFSDPKKPRASKDPDAVIDITFDWSVWLDDIGSVTISDVTFTVNGVASVGSFSDGTKVTVFVSGGTPGSSASVACKITTLTTPIRTDERTIYLDIADE